MLHCMAGYNRLKTCDLWLWFEF